jgi:hypothetical protein
MDQFRKAGERIVNLRYGKTKTDGLAFPKGLIAFETQES